jgi:hypothetical protein
MEILFVAVALTCSAPIYGKAHGESYPLLTIKLFSRCKAILAAALG